MGWMQDLCIIALVINGIVELMKVYGGVSWALQALTKGVSSRRGAEFSIAGLVSLLDLATANNTVAIVGAGPMAQELNKKFDIDPRRTAGLLDVVSCGWQGLVPYGGQLLVAASFAKASPVEIMPYNWYCMLILLTSVIAISIGYPKFKGPATDEYGNVVYIPKN
ncbi:MAG: Na+/H+ antiporter NhaC family protein [Brevinema sp.]